MEITATNFSVLFSADWSDNVDEVQYDIHFLMPVALTMLSANIFAMKKMSTMMVETETYFDELMMGIGSMLAGLLEIFLTNARSILVQKYSIVDYMIFFFRCAMFGLFSAELCLPWTTAHIVNVHNRRPLHGKRRKTRWTKRFVEFPFRCSIFYGSWAYMIHVMYPQSFCTFQFIVLIYLTVSLMSSLFNLLPIKYKITFLGRNIFLRFIDISTLLIPNIFASVADIMKIKEEYGDVPYFRRFFSMRQIYAIMCCRRMLRAFQPYWSEEEAAHEFRLSIDEEGVLKSSEAAPVFFLLTLCFAEVVNTQQNIVNFLKTGKLI